VRFCDQSSLSIPYQAQYKLSGAYQLPVGFQASGVLASYPGTQMNAPASGPWLGTENYIVNRAIAPGLVQSSLTVPLVAPGASAYYLRQTQLDLRLARHFRMHGVDLTGAVDIFNALNASSVLSQIVTYGSALGTPTSVIYPRVFRFGVLTKF
jgi:hypothetical protein